jgi:hypothetical protein
MASVGVLAGLALFPTGTSGVDSLLPTMRPLRHFVVPPALSTSHYDGTTVCVSSDLGQAQHEPVGRQLYSHE